MNKARSVSMADCSQEFKNYLTGVFQYKRLYPKEELNLIKLAQRGDKTALENVVMSNMPVVIGMAWTYANMSRISVEDLVGQGTEGLIESIKWFNPGVGQSLAAYAKSYIRRGMLRIINEQTYPLSISVEQGMKISKSPTKFSWLNTSHISLHETTSNGYTVEDDLPEEEETHLLDSIMERERKDAINKALSTLTRDEQRVIKMFHGFVSQRGMTIQQIAKKLGLSWGRVSDLHKLGMFKLERELERQGMAGLEDI